MYTTKALKQLKNIWDKDEKSFEYCIELLKNKIDALEYFQFYIYYYIYNQNFEKAVDYLSILQAEPTLKKTIEFYDSDDFFQDLCCCISADACCDCTCDTCNDCCCCDELGDTTCGQWCATGCCLYCTGATICGIWECCCK